MQEVAHVDDPRRTALGSRLLRPALALGAAALVLALAGDRSRAATVPAVVLGQDPLEVLELKVRPNVIVVLDSSGSMTETVGVEQTGSGDHPRSRLWQGKQVLKQLVANNQDKVSFQFGTYTQLSMNLNNQNPTTSGVRFQYWTTDQLSPSMVGSELSVQGAYQDTLGRGLQSWQIIQPQWGTFYFEEDVSGSGGADATVCSASLTGLPKFYARGGSGGVATAPSVSTAPQNLAFELQTAINAVGACATGTRQNTYRVNYDPATGRFSFTRQTGTRFFRVLWGQGPNNIRNALAETNTGTTAWQSTASVNTDAPWRLLYRNTNNGAGFGGTRWIEAVAGTNVTNYQLRANRLWNGEVIRVQANGMVCGMTFPTAAEKTNPATLTLQLVADNCGADQPQAVTFRYAGGDFSGNSVSCRGFRSKSSLIPCDLQSPPAPTQVAMLTPYLEDEIPLAATGEPADWTTNGAANGSAGDSVPDGVPDYLEAQDGGWGVSYVWIAPTAKADGSTPIANSLIDIKGAASGTNDCLVNPPPLANKYDPVTGGGTIGACVQRGFSQLWQNGQAGATTMAGPAPWQISPIRQHGVCPGGAAACPDSDRRPKEKTIVVFVTDGDDTCYTKTGSNNGDPNALRAAYWAARLYQPIDPADPASSVQTYVIGYGNGATPYRLNWIAWGGSGLDQPGLNIADDGNQWTDTTANINNARARCTTCVDAFIAPDAATLAAQMQSVIDQGATDGDFLAQQSITDSVYELAHLAGAFDGASPGTRYDGIVPVRIVSSFSMPGFRGQQRAYYRGPTGASVQAWSAGDVLFNQISTAMGSCNTGGAGGAANECTFAQLHAGATDASIGTSNARIKRRIYTTSRNGVFSYTLDRLMDGASTERVSLWPPTAPGLLHANLTDDGPKTYDQALGLPPDAPTSFPPNPIDGFCDASNTTSVPKKPYDRCWFEWLQRRFQACSGNNLQPNCTAAAYGTRMLAARREAREIMIAFLAGAATVPAPTAGIKRATASVGTPSAPAGSLLFKARTWMLADSELATAAIVTPPLDAVPEAFQDAYKQFVDGVRESGSNPDSGSGVRWGIGLRNPDLEGSFTPQSTAINTNAALKPVMTVVYAPANDMLHALRAGPCDTPGLSVPCTDAGGEELWGFVPYDQLHTVMLRAAHEPQGRNNHVYSIARGVRFSDVFVPGTSGRTIGSTSVVQNGGMWRRILYFGRGIGGKYLTALDVTAPGPYTASALSATPPVPLWSRGNPDTQEGVVPGTANGSAADTTRYATMGETWSIPAVAYVDDTFPAYSVPPGSPPRNYVLFVGSGYGAVGEGTHFYTLDAMTGEVLAAVDVGSRGGFATYRNAIVANAVGFNPASFENLLRTVHPATKKVTRVYVGDLHGRLWKFLARDPGVALPMADLGADQPVGTAVSLIGLPQSGPVPYVFATSGAERRADGPFKVFAFRDDGADDDFAPGAGSTVDGITTYLPAVQLFNRVFDQGTPDANCGYTEEAVFRGTAQPATAFECPGGITNSGGSITCPVPVVGRVFFTGTRLSLPNTKFAPITPLACGSGIYPCRSQFDSIIYALGAESGQAAYDLNASGDDAYRIFRDSRITSTTFQGDPDPNRGGSSFTPDEGLMKGIPKPPPPPGVPPTSTTASANVRMFREPGQPAPSVRYGTTVCQ